MNVIEVDASVEIPDLPLYITTLDYVKCRNYKFEVNLMPNVFCNEYGLLPGVPLSIFKLT